MKWLYEHKQSVYNSTQWPRAVVGFACVLIFLWMSLGMSWIWGTPKAHKKHTEITYITLGISPNTDSHPPSSLTRELTSLAPEDSALDTLPPQTLALEAATVNAKSLSIQPTWIF